MDALLQWGIGIVLAVQDVPGLEGLARFFTFLGTEEFFLIVMPALYWCVDAALGLILGISLSRVYLGVHFPTDLLGGWLIGGALLFAFAQWERPAAAWLRRLGLWPQIGLALAASLAFLTLNSVTLAGLASASDPAEWEQNAAAARPDDPPPAIDPRNPRSAVNGAGMIFGLGSGLALAARRARFDARGPLANRVARFVVGLLGVLAFWVGLSAVFPTEPFLLGMALRYLRYALTVFWALFLAPWTFLKTGLATPAASSPDPGVTPMA